MSQAQPGILAAVPAASRYLFFSLQSTAAARACLQQLQTLADGRQTVVGIGQSLALALGATIPGLRQFPVKTAAAVEVASTPFALWCWLRGEDRGELWHRSRKLVAALAPAFQLEQSIDAFIYANGRDLSGYEDGTENPKDEAATLAAIVTSGQPELAGSSFVAVQQWLHDMRHFELLSSNQQDQIIGRTHDSNVELTDAPASAHVKRTAQESFSPPAFILRRSMPWLDGMRAGLVFVAFGRSFDAFEALLTRMVGEEDKVTDALFSFTRPLTGAYFWCPGMTAQGKLNFAALSC